MKHTTCTLLFLLTTFLGFSQGWERFYEANLARANCLESIQLPDGDYIILSSGGTSQHLLRTITRTNEFGIEKWHKLIPADYVPVKMFLLPSGNIDLICSNEILKMDADGNMYPADFSPGIWDSRDVIQLSDGYLSIYNNGSGTIWMRKVDQDGLEIWFNSAIVGNLLPVEQAVVATQDGGFLYAAMNQPNIALVKFDANGNLQWTTSTYAPQEPPVADKLIATSDAFYLAHAYGGGNNRIFKFDTSGALLWWKDFDTFPQFEERRLVVSDFIEATDGGLVFAGKMIDITPPISFHSNPGVLKLNSTGDVEFLYTSPHEGQANSIIQSIDGGYHLVGMAAQEAGGPVDEDAKAYAFKLDANGTLYSSFLRGQVMYDENLDCSVSAGELPLGGWIVRATTGVFDFYGVTNAEGLYSIAVNPDTFTLEVLEPNNLWTACVNPIVLNFSSDGDTIYNDFSLQAAVNCPAMQVDIGTPFLRRCFDNTLYVQYCNLGTVTAENVFIEVTLDSFLTLQSSTIPHSGQTGNTYTFPIGEVGIGECGSFNILALVSCITTFGQTLCMEAHAFPDSICGVSFNWSGASMVARAQCEGDSLVVLELENVGTAPTSEPIDYIVIEDQIIFLQSSEIFGPGELRTIEQPANGATWRISSEQEPTHPGSPLPPSAFIEGCGLNSTNTFSTGFVNDFPQNDGDISIDIDCEQVIGAYDPNDKMALPKGYGAQHYIEPNTDLEYRIRFQNTGTDTAFTVVIRDTLSPFLDPASIKAGASSHNYEFDLEGDAVAIFWFDNILLPDSNVNEALSHGFVSFSISQKPDVALESVIENEAAIYFDFNDPVITNPVFHTIGINFIEVATDVNELPEGLGELLAYPNPSAGEVTFEIPSELPVSATFVLYDSFGRLAMRKGFEGQRFLFNGNELPKGIYFYEVKVEGLGRYSGKVILK